MDKREHLKELVIRLRDIFNKNKIVILILTMVTAFAVMCLSIILFGMCISIHEIAIRSLNMAMGDLYYLYGLDLVNWTDMASLKYSIYGIIIGSLSILLALYLVGLTICWKAFIFIFKVYKGDDEE